MSTMQSIWRLWRQFGAAVGLLAAAASLARADAVFWAGSNALWEQGSNWEDVLFNPAAVPAAGDAVYVTSGHGGVDRVTLSSDTAILNGLVVADGFRLNTDGYRLWNSDADSADTLIQGSSVGGPSRISVVEHVNGSNFRSFDTDQLHVVQGGWLSMRGGLAEVDDEAEVDASSSITGYGVLLFENAFGSTGTRLLNNNGTIGLDNIGGNSGPYQLELRTSNGGYLDLDGSSNAGVLDARVAGTGTLLVNAPLIDPFDGTIFVGGDDAIEFTHAWNLHSQMNMESSTAPARLAGAEAFVEINGVIDVADNGTAIIDAPLTVSFGTVQVGSDAEIQLHRETIFGGGGPGQLLLDANSHVVVHDDTTVDHSGLEFDWDGSGETADTTVGPAASLTIDANKIETGGGSHHGDLTVDSGTVEVNTDGPWRKVGQVTLSNDGVNGAPTVSGSHVQLGSGALDVTGGPARIDAPVTVESGRVINVAGDARLSFRDDTTIETGTTWNNNGVVNFGSGTTLISGSATIGGIVDLDGNSGGGSVDVHSTLTLRVDAIEDDAADNTVDDTAIIVRPTGQLQVEFADPNDTWAIAENSSMLLVGMPGRQSAHVTGNGLANRGQLTVVGAPVWTNIAQTNFSSSGQTSLNESLLMRGDSRVKAGHLFSGSGSLFNESSATMTLEDGAAVEVPVVNAGAIDVGDASAIARVAEFRQKSGGVLGLSIDGATVATEYDQLRIMGSTQLAGTLDVVVNDNGGSYADPTVPGTFDAFQLMEAGSVTGAFDDIVYDGSALLPEFGAGADGDFEDHIIDGLFRLVDYHPNGLDLINYKALPGDANGDGAVDATDFNVWNANKFTPGSDWTTGDFNGDGLTDVSDYTIWNANKFTSVPLGQLSRSLKSVPEPATSSFVFAALAVAPLTWRRARR